MRVELLIGRRVVAMNGRAVGRIEELRADTRDGAAVVQGICIGADAALERFSVRFAMAPPPRQRSGYLVRPGQIDLSDPGRPRLLVPVAELERL